jgi:hypothetical protein
MQQPQLIGYADIAEVRTVTGAIACNELLAVSHTYLYRSSITEVI